MIEKKLKNRSPYFLLLIIVLVGMHNCYRVEKFTHLTDEDFAWTDCYSPDDKLLFKSTDGQIDTMTITKIDIHNSIFPYMPPYSQWAEGSEYIAAIFLDFNIQHEGLTYEGSFFVTKNVSYAPPMLYGEIGNLHTDTPFFSQEESELYTIYTPCFTVNRENAKDNKRLAPTEDTTKHIEKFEWCKHIGLKSYTFRNGEVYELVEDEK